MGNHFLLALALWATLLSSPAHPETASPTAAPPGTPTPSPATRSYCLSDSAVDFAMKAEQVRFDRHLPGGAHTQIFNGAEVLKALNSYCGDTRLDAKLLAQIRYLLPGNRGPTATGGYQDQKQLGAALMFLLAKHTPRIWAQLTVAERGIIDIDMEAHLYSTVFTTKDGVAGSLGIDGNTGLNRDWNPNHQNGMVGIVIVTALYFGFDDFENKLATFDYTEFLNKLRDHKMINLIATYANENSPSKTDVQAGIRQKVNDSFYAFHGISERDLRGLFGYITDRTFSRTVNCGLNRGAGIGGWGKIVRNCGLLPNQGQHGMLMEFDSLDGGGPRSDAWYAYDGWYVLNYSRLALQIFDYLTPNDLSTTISITESGGSTEYGDVVTRSFIGTQDLYFKLSSAKSGGYLDYSNGAPGAKATVLDSKMSIQNGALINLEIFNILQRNLGQAEVKF